MSGNKAFNFVHLNYKPSYVLFLIYWSKFWGHKITKRTHARRLQAHNKIDDTMPIPSSMNAD